MTLIDSEMLHLLDCMKQGKPYPFEISPESEAVCARVVRQMEAEAVRVKLMGPDERAAFIEQRERDIIEGGAAFICNTAFGGP